MAFVPSPTMPTIDDAKKALDRQLADVIGMIRQAKSLAVELEETVVESQLGWALELVKKARVRTAIMAGEAHDRMMG